MSSIISNIISIAEKITNLPALIAEKLGLGTLFSDLKTSLLAKFVDLSTDILSIPSSIGAFIDNMRDTLLAKLIDLGTDILSLPSSIGEFITSMRDVLKEKLVEVVDGIKALPDKIAEGIKGIFIPDEEYLQSKIDYLKGLLQRLGVNSYNMSDLFDEEQPFKDITVNLYGQEVVIVDMGVVDGVLDYFRPVIRGLMYLLLVFYHFNQFMGLIGQQTITLGGIINSVKGSNSNDN